MREDGSVGEGLQQRGWRPNFTHASNKCSWVIKEGLFCPPGSQINSCLFSPFAWLPPNCNHSPFFLWEPGSWTLILIRPAFCFGSQRWWCTCLFSFSVCLRACVCVGGWGWSGGCLIFHYVMVKWMSEVRVEILFFKGSSKVLWTPICLESSTGREREV